MKDFKAKGYFRGNKKESGKFPNTFDGYFLDQLDFSASIQSYQDIDDLITFLKIHRTCFVMPSNTKVPYKPEHYEQSKTIK